MSEQSIQDRLSALENEVRTLKSQKGEGNAVKKEKKEKKPRAQTEYNKFVSSYINEQKEKLGDDFKHKVAFSEAAQKWNEQKKSKE